MTNGSKGQGNNTIEINGGTFNANIQSSGYIACGIYVANSDTVKVNAGTFNVIDGVGILARSGSTVVSDEVVFNITSTQGGITSGWVGDKKINIPTGKEVVLDLLANYPGGTPTATAKNVYTLE